MEKPTYEELKRKALKLRLELKKAVVMLFELQQCNSFQLREKNRLSRWASAIDSGKKLLEETPIQL